MSGVYRRYQKGGSGWGVWLLAGGLAAAVGVAVLVVFIVRGNREGSSAGLGIALVGPPLTDDMTHRELLELLRSRKVTVFLIAGGTNPISGASYATFTDQDGLDEETAMQLAGARVTKHATETEARDHAGASNFGFHWGRFSFRPAGLSGENFGTRIKKALGVR